MTIRNSIIVILLISLGCTEETKKNKEIIFLFKDQGYLPSIASKVIDPPSNTITAMPQPDYGIDMKIDASKNEIYISFGPWIVKDPDGGFNSGKIIYNLQSNSKSADYISIDPSRNRIYWIDNSSMKIYMGSMDGKLSPTALFGDLPVVSANSFGFSSCTAITVDTRNNILFFSDSTAKIIYKADLNSPSNKPVAFVDTSNSQISVPLDLAISNDGKQLFWIDKKLSGIWVTNTTTGITTQMYNSGYTEHIYYDGNANDLYWSYDTGISKATLSSPNWKQIFEVNYITDFVIND